MTSRVRAYRRLAGWAIAAIALGAVFLGYTNPHLMVDLANQVWACF
jgi:hypothetical protein